MKGVTKLEAKDVRELSSKLQMSPGLAKDMLILAGGDKRLVEEASDESQRLDELKATIIDMRFCKLEQK